MKEKILQLKLRKECGHPRALLCTRRGAGGCGLRWRLLLPCKDRKKEYGGHHCFLRRVLYGRECQDTEPGQKGTDARSYGRLSDGSYGEARTDSGNEREVRGSRSCLLHQLHGRAEMSERCLCNLVKCHQNCQSFAEQEYLLYSRQNPRKIRGFTGPGEEYHHQQRILSDPRVDHR